MSGLFDAKIHPEQYSNTLSDSQYKQLHKSIIYICETACNLLADSDRFPEEWLFKHRWGKGKKDSTNTLPNGEKIVHLKVSGRTSAVVPSVQKKTGPVAGDIDGDGEEEKPKKGKKRKSGDAEEDGDEALPNGSAKKTTPKVRKSKFKEELSDEDTQPPAKEAKGRKTTKAEKGEVAPAGKKRGLANGAAKPNLKRTKTDEAPAGRRRSSRKSG